MSSLTDEGESGSTTVSPAGSSSGLLSIYDDLRASSGITYSQTPQGEWNIKKAQHELKASTVVHEQQQKAAEAEFDRQQRAKDQDHKRLIRLVAFVAAMVIVAASLIFGGILVAWSDDNSAQQAGLAIISVILGGVTGGIGGYIAGGGRN